MTPKSRPAYVEAATPEEGLALLKGAKRGNKFHAVPVTINGERYDSTSEGNLTYDLDAMVAGRVLTAWKPHPVFPLLLPVPGAPPSRTRHRRTELLAGFGGCPVGVEWDFQCWPDPVGGGPTCVLDKKGWATLTEAFFLKAALFVRVHPGIPLYAAMPDGSWIKA